MAKTFPERKLRAHAVLRAVGVLAGVAAAHGAAALCDALQHGLQSQEVSGVRSLDANLRQRARQDVGRAEEEKRTAVAR